MKIKDAFNYEELEEVLNAPIDFFHQFGTVTETKDGVHIFSDKGATILGVAHLDSVQDAKHFYVNAYLGIDHIYNPSLDDRLGAYILLKVLPRMGINTDILLTEGEESGRSTAQHFTTDKEYRWMYSFDRGGTDAVHYVYSMKDWTDAMRKHFKSVSHGSNSDINHLKHLGCCGLNVGTAYYDYHSIRAYAVIPEVLAQIGKFIQFYQDNKKERFEYVPAPVKTYYTTYYSAPNSNAAPPPPQITQPTTVMKKEEEELDDDWDTGVYNPYDKIVVDMALDIHQYEENGVVTPPTKCSFCLVELSEKTLGKVFIGICKRCEPYAIECVVCHEYVFRELEPDEDMGHELYWGLCTVCERELTIESKERRFNGNKDETDRLESIDDERYDEHWWSWTSR